MNIAPENQSCKFSPSSLMPLLIIRFKVIAIFAQWTDAENEVARSQVQQLLSSFQSTAKGLGLLLDFFFM
jgi:hypothetical protein